MQIDIKIDLSEILKQSIKDRGVEKVLDILFDKMENSDADDAFEWLKESYGLVDET